MTNKEILANLINSLECNSVIFLGDGLDMDDITEDKAADILKEARNIVNEEATQ